MKCKQGYTKRDAVLSDGIIAHYRPISKPRSKWIMAWQLVNKPVTLPATLKLAKEFVDMEAAPRDRTLKERRLQVYQRLYEQKLFRPVTWAKCLCKETDTIYRVNGKHTSIMLSGLTEIKNFWVTIEEYIADTLEDVANLYSTFDSKMQSRSAQDIYCSFAGTVTELQGVTARNISLSVAGMAYHLGKEKESAAEKAELLIEHSGFVLWLDTLLAYGESSVRSLRRYPVAAAMFGTWSKVKGPATEFWEAVRDETGSTPTLPDRKLAKYLLTSGVIASTKSNSRSSDIIRKSGPREMYVKCLHAWNAWRRGEVTNLNYHADKEAPSIK